MEVDRVSQMGGVGQEQTPSWTRARMRRRKFSEDAELDETDIEEAETEQSTEPGGDDSRTLDLLA
jgi:hypothetical protein